MRRSPVSIVVIAVSILVLLPTQFVRAQGADEPTSGADVGADPLIVQPPVRVEPIDNAILTFDGVEYPGALELSNSADGRIRVVDVVEFDTYLSLLRLGVDGAPSAALEAVAVSARTLALREIADRGGSATLGGFDVCSGPGCQPFEGLVDGSAEGLVGDLDAVARGWAEAVASTSHDALLSGGRPLLAMYHGSSVGGTRAFDEVFSGTSPAYLRAVDTRFESEGRVYEWSRSFDRPKLDRILRGAGMVGGAVTGITVSPSDGSRPDEVSIESANAIETRAIGEFTDAFNASAARLFPNEFVSADALESADFTVTEAGDSVAFAGTGRGHKVGLSLDSAAGLAESGFDRDEILGRFYSGITPETNVATPSAIRVLVAEGAERVQVGSSGAFRVVSATGRTVLDEALLTWTVTANADQTLGFFGPEGAGTPLALTGFSVPLQSDAGRATGVEFVLSRPARVTLKITDASGAEYDAPSSAVLGAGPQRLEVTIDEPGAYDILVEAVDGDDRVSTEAQAIEVLTVGAGPTVLGAVGLLVLLSALIIGAIVFKSTRRRKGTTG